MGKKSAADWMSLQALQRRSRNYFARCDREELLYGEAGLALYLGVSLETLRDWYDGKSRPDLTEEVRRAYLRIQAQVESSPAYMGKGMVSKAILLMKQPRLGGYLDRADSRQQDLNVHVKMGGNMEESDLQ